MKRYNFRLILNLVLIICLAAGIDAFAWDTGNELRNDAGIYSGDGGALVASEEDNGALIASEEDNGALIASEEIEIIPDDNDSRSNDELLMGYFEKMSGLPDPGDHYSLGEDTNSSGSKSFLSIEDSSDEDSSDDDLSGDDQAGDDLSVKKSAGSRLSGTNLVVYNCIREQAAKVAAGELESTVFEVPLESEDPLKGLNLEKNAWTAEELGVDNLVVSTESGMMVADEARDAVIREIGLDLDHVIDVLLADCPYEFYWYDKTVGVRLSGMRFALRTITQGDNEPIQMLVLNSGFTFRFPVSEDYALRNGDELIPYSVDTSCGQKVQTAVTTAASIIDEYKDEYDYLKLEGYRQEICDLVDYDREAPSEVYSSNGELYYGDPWQMISVFDGDPSTKVVCEGYSKAFQYLCDLSEFKDDNVRCISVIGKLKFGSSDKGASHMWNIVTMEDGCNYLVDVTNCDGYDGHSTDKLFQVGYTSGDVEKGYVFNLGFHDAFSESLFNYIYIYSDSMRKVFTTEELTINSENYIPKGDHLHVWTDYTVDVPSTCKEHGSESYHCRYCDVINEESVRSMELAPHDFGETTVKVAPTYYKEGTGIRTCAVCGETEEVSIPKLARTSISGAKVSGITSKVYTGKSLKQSVKVTRGGKTLVYGTDYTLAYKNNKNVGTAKVTITGKNKYTGSITKTFRINPKGTSLSKLKKAKKGFKVSWKKQTGKMSSKRITGYQIQCSTSSKFASGNKTVNVKGYTKASGKITGLKAKKKYYVRIRTYTVTGGTTYYSAWSKEKSVKTK